MTTLDRHPAAASIVEQLDAVAVRRRALRLVAGVLAVAAVALIAALVTLPILGYLPAQPAVWLRWTLLIASCAAVAAAVGWFVVRAIVWRQSPAATARFVESALPRLRNDLINSVLLADDPQQTSPELVALAIGETRRHLARVNIRRSVSLASVRRWALVTAVAALVLGAWGALDPAGIRRGWAALSAPGGYVPVVGEVELTGVSPGDATQFAGEPLTISAAVRNEDARELEGRVIVAGRDEPVAMLAGGDFRKFTCPLGAPEEDVQYAVQIGDTRWPLDKPWYTVTVLSKVSVDGLDVRYDFPPYTALEPRRVPDAAGPVEAPMGTAVTLRLRLSTAVPTAVLETRAGETTAMTTTGGREFSGAFNVDADGGYRMVLRDSRGRVLQQLPDGNGDGGDTYSDAGRTRMSGYYPVRAIPDAPPKIEIVSPGADVSLPPGGTLELTIRASDNYGLTALRLVAEMARDGRRIEEKDLPLSAPAGGAGWRVETTVTHTFTVPADLPDDGTAVIVYYAAATDNRRLPGVGGPQTTASSKFKITVRDAARAAAERARRYDQLRERLMAILRIAEAQRVNGAVARERTGTLAAARADGTDVANAHAELRAIAGEVVDGHRAIRSELLDLVESFPFEREMHVIKQTAAMLAANEAQVAIDQSLVVAAAVERLDAERRPFMLLGDTQDAIIDTLQTMLAILPSLAGQVGEKDESPAGEDLSPEAAEKLAALRKGLEEFIDAQHKAIEASERLAKRPVDEFSPADEKLLAELQATQDKWEKFLNEKFADFSKLAEQDFSNPTTMKELIAVKTDVTMARDALAKKAAEIATAAADNAVEDAESLTANIEKWLPDKPEREAWKMEEPPGQDNIEMPELPSELEDLVGDLLEEEEDLFDEMADVTSKHTASGDKGIGWDTLDGPISNMNAQGVTGNQLPNPNELSGRSGEGRQGKSSGEFVEDKAVGKGGRRTPTRLTPEPFQTGQIDDVSEEPAGGATGGGKVSGGGAEGLEGPVPAPLKKEMDRLAGKQAALVNRMERLREKFPPGYGGFKALQAITLMDRVQKDLASYRYRNVLRRRDVTLEALGQVKVFTSGTIEVDADASGAMPNYVRDDIADAMSGEMPADYREVLQQYYRRLSAEGE